MTMCATSPQEPISAGARPDLDHKLSDRARDALFYLNDQLDEHAPTDCQINAAEFDQVEQTITELTKLRQDPTKAYIAVDGKAVPVRGPLTAVLQGCATCPVRNACLAAMRELDYTGIAGGTILHNGKPYDYAKARPKRRQTESEIPDGLW
ncbi:hypothetical protein [Mycolicibacterium lutetiense]